MYIDTVGSRRMSKTAILHTSPYQLADDADRRDGSREVSRGHPALLGDIYLSRSSVPKAWYVRLIYPQHLRPQDAARERSNPFAPHRQTNASVLSFCNRGRPPGVGFPGGQATRLASILSSLVR
jgi:hypothetical protein